jgi:hypothetical protein
MDYFKKIEQELIVDWHKLQLEKIMHIRDAAIKAYYIKFRLYQIQKRRQFLFAEV